MGVPGGGEAERNQTPWGAAESKVTKFSEKTRGEKKGCKDGCANKVKSVYHGEDELKSAKRKKTWR